MPDMDLSRVTWRRSSYSGGNGNCVEIADLLDDTIAVRDSKVPNGPMLMFNRTVWAAYIADIKQGRLDG